MITILNLDMYAISLIAIVITITLLIIIMFVDSKDDIKELAATHYSSSRHSSNSDHIYSSGGIFR